MTATLSVMFDSNGDGVPETDITGYIVSGTERGGLQWTRGKSSTSQDYAAGTCSILVLDPSGDFSPENPNGALRTTVGNFETGAVSDRTLNATTQQRLGQTFQLAAANEVDKVSLRLKRTGSPGGSIYVELWHTSSNLPASLYELTAVSRTVTTAGIGTAYEWVSFTFEVPQLLAASTTYAIVLRGNGSYSYSASNQIDWAYSSSGYANGQAAIYNGTAWSGPGNDQYFRISRNDIRDGRMVWVTVTEGGIVYPVWTGILRSVTVYPDRQQLTSYLVFSDYNDDAANKQATLATRQSYKYEDAINELWTSAGGLGLSAGQVSVGDEDNGLYVWYQEPHANIADISDKLADSVGGSVYWKAVSAANGYKRAVFRSDVADATESYAVTEDWGLDYDEKDFDYRWDSAEAQIINKAIVRSNPRAIGVAGTVVGTYALPAAGEPWGASESRTIWVDFTDPVVRDSCISPVSGTDITAGFTVTSFTEYSHKAKVVITAGASGGALLKLQVRGQPYEMQDQVTAIAEDAISQAIYGVREHFVDNIYVQRFGRADSLAQVLLNKHRRAYTQPVVKRIGGSTNNWASLAARDIGDRVTLELPARINGGYDSDYYIDGIESTISVATTGGTIGQWSVKYRLRKAIEAGQYLRVDGDPGIDVGLIAP